MKVINCKKNSNTFLPHTHFKKKNGVSFWMSHLIPLGGGEIPNFTVFTIEKKDFPSPRGKWGLIKKLTPFFLLKWVWGRKVLLHFLH